MQRGKAVDQRDEHRREPCGRDRELEPSPGALDLDDCCYLSPHLEHALPKAGGVRRITRGHGGELSDRHVEGGRGGEDPLEPGHECRQPVVRLVDLELLAQPGEVGPAALVHQREEKVGLVAEVRVEGAPGEAGDLGDLFDGRGMETVRGKDSFTGGHERVAGTGLGFGPRQARGARGRQIDMHDVLGYRVYVNSIVAGGTEDFLLVRHLVLRGSQHEIGRALAEESLRSFPPVPALGGPTPLLNRARRRWFERNWPQHFARLHGIADAYGVDLFDDCAAPCELPAVPFAAGCSALWCPPRSSTDGRTRIGRNFDFMTASAMEIAGLPPEPGQPPMMSRPYVIEAYPEDARASITVAACDLSGCLDGCNDAGLAVVVLADDESTTLRPAHRLQAGVHELQLPRLLLDTCSSVDEAIETLYCTKQYDNFITCHYLVADAHGDAFVWERDTHNAEHVVRAAADDPLTVTNFLLHRYEGTSSLPEDDPSSNMFQRAKILATRAQAAPLSGDDLSAALDAVCVESGDPVARTLWRSLYDLDDRSLTIDFYLGRAPGGCQRRSAPRSFSLGLEAAA